MRHPALLFSTLLSLSFFLVVPGNALEERMPLTPKEPPKVSAELMKELEGMPPEEVKALLERLAENAAQQEPQIDPELVAPARMLPTVPVKVNKPATASPPLLPNTEKAEIDPPLFSIPQFPEPAPMDPFAAMPSVSVSKVGISGATAAPKTRADLLQSVPASSSASSIDKKPADIASIPRAVPISRPEAPIALDDTPEEPTSLANQKLERDQAKADGTETPAPSFIDRALDMLAAVPKRIKLGESQDTSSSASVTPPADTPMVSGTDAATEEVVLSPDPPAKAIPQAKPFSRVAIRKVNGTQLASSGAFDSDVPDDVMVVEPTGSPEVVLETAVRPGDDRPKKAPPKPAVVKLRAEAEPVPHAKAATALPWSGQARVLPLADGNEVKAQQAFAAQRGEIVGASEIQKHVAQASARDRVASVPTKTLSELEPAATSIERRRPANASEAYAQAGSVPMIQSEPAPIQKRTQERRSPAEQEHVSMDEDRLRSLLSSTSGSRWKDESRIPRALFTSRVVDREPQDAITSASSKMPEVVFYTELQAGMEGRTVLHRWEADGAHIYTEKFRTTKTTPAIWSRLPLSAKLKGRTITVTVVDADGHEYARDQIEVR